ncbi:MAG: hypothetical protein H0T42_31195 [Deltaproteobacteria bacterium]|nr:hypothetical protein [Deltaproteobacteria bacterium]
MRYVLARLALLPALGGCSLIYNESNIPTPMADAGPDGEIDAEIPVDADPSMMNITGVTPSVITEGQGADGSRSAVIVIEGVHMVKSGLMVMVTPKVTSPVQKTPLMMVNMAGIDLDAAGRQLAVPIVLDVDDRGGTTGLTAGDLIALDITVMQTVPGGPTITRQLTGMLSVKGLPELTNATLPAAGLPALSEYSEVNLTAGTIKGVAGLAEPVVIRATASITIGNSVTTSVNGVAMTGGPGAGNGGMGGAAIGGAPGAPGTGPAPGAPSAGVGRYEGDEQLKSHAEADKNRGSGGAGANGSVVLGAGGNGGGGGGSIELTAGGDLTVGTITAQGAIGGAGAAGAGGGGSGGVVLVRSGRTLSAGTLNVTSLGTGQPGRARYDAATATVANAGSAFRGPMFVNVPLIANEQKPTFTVAGQPSKPFSYYFRTADGSEESMLFTDNFPGTGMKAITLPAALYPGLNELCLVVGGGDQSSETRNCVHIAHLYKPPAM